jgi:predicted secreted protein
LDLPAGFATPSRMAAAAGPLSRTLAPRASLVDADGTAAQASRVEFRDGAVSFSRVRHFDETKAPGLTRVTVADERHPFDSSVLFEQRLDGLFGGTEIQIAYINILH